MPPASRDRSRPPPQSEPTSPEGPTIIVARARNGAIGLDNRLPWHLPEDLAHFRRTTMGHTIVMGRKTWASIGKPLPGRRMVVLSRGTPALPEGVERQPGLAEALCAHAAGEHRAQQVFVIGGAEVYRAARELATRMIVTEIDLQPRADTYFETPDPQAWEVTSRTDHEAKDGTRYAIVEYRRRHNGGSTGEVVNSGPNRH